MVRIDERLCTACGICVDSCSRGAISIIGRAAVIDENLCTSCGRCIDTCLTGAIVAPLSTSSVRPLEGALVPSQIAQPVRAGAPAQSTTPDRVLPTTPIVEKVVSGLAALLSLAFGIKGSLGRTTGAPGTGGDISAAGAGGRRAGIQGRQGSAVVSGQRRGCGSGPAHGQGRRRAGGSRRGNRSGMYMRKRTHRPERSIT